MHNSTMVYNVFVRRFLSIQHQLCCERSMLCMTGWCAEPRYDIWWYTLDPNHIVILVDISIPYIQVDVWWLCDCRNNGRGPINVLNYAYVVHSTSKPISLTRSWCRPNSGARWYGIHMLLRWQIWFDLQDRHCCATHVSVAGIKPLLLRLQ